MMRILTAFVLIFVLSACNTVEGIGKDIKKGGAAIEKASK
jgi:predicted small secreted protein